MNLQKFGVQELSVQEQEQVVGGWLWNFFSIGQYNDGFHCYILGFRVF
jgi:hypothetical protein